MVFPCHEVRESHRHSTPSEHLESVELGAKGRKAVLPKFLLGRDNSNMDSMDEDFASITKLESAQKLLIEVNVYVDCICVAAATAMHRIPKDHDTKFGLLCLFCWHCDSFWDFAPVLPQFHFWSSPS